MSPFAKELFDIASPHPLKEFGVEEEYRFGHVWHFSEKPVTLPTADPKEIFNELDQLQRIRDRRNHGTPGEL